MSTLAVAAILVAAVTSLLPLVSAGAPPPAAAPLIGKPGCDTRCGNVDVPFPFGFGPARCFGGPGFRLTCDNTTRPGRPRLLLGDDDGIFEVKEISIKDRTLRVVRPPIFSDAMNATGGSGAVMKGSWGSGGLFYRNTLYAMGSYSQLVVTGCNVQATLLTNTTADREGFQVGCSTYCAGVLTAEVVKEQYEGYCSASIGQFDTYYDVELKRLGRGAAVQASEEDVPVSVLVAENNWFNQERAVALMNLDKPPSARHSKQLQEIPVILDWECYNDGSCNGSLSPLGHCHTEEGDGFLLCDCDKGYQGNPYLTDGCQDIDECERPEDHGCFGECKNTLRSFECSCRKGLRGNSSLPLGCVKPERNTGLIIGLSIAVVPCLVLSALGAILVTRKIKHHRIKRLKQKFFNQNRGQLLQQLVSNRSDIGERMIISLKELEKATNNFDPTRKIGGGGHGTVYKGILSDLNVVAIKKSNIVVQREIDEFINEVAILSQINHRNVVKLHGCCLETEVPLLAYEFISNGTLADHLHHGSERSIPWRDRLRIASEVGKAIAYLHSAVSIPIIHRDIKSSNILLDAALTSKVSDFGASRYIPTDETGIAATAVQGTIGYLDPMYYYTGRLSEMSDVYSFGVLLVELLTRKMPMKYRTLEGEGLVVQFVELLEQGNLVDILDKQVVEEGGSDVEEVAVLAASCIQLKGENRPTMRQVEMALEGLQENKEHVPFNSRLDQNEQNYIATSYPSTRRRTSLDDVSRRYREEDEFSLSARYPR